MLQEKILSGAYGIVLTPFKECGEVDYTLFAKYVERATHTPLSGLVVCGSTGEFTRLSFQENCILMKIASEIIRGKKQLICGATGSDSYQANKYMEFISEINADGALIAPPYYFPLSDEEIISYYLDVAKNNSGNVPIVGYNIPQCTNKISIPIFEELLKLTALKGFKNSWNDMQEITSEIALRNEHRPDVSMLTGLDACLYGTLSLGGDGLFTAIAYLLPEVMCFIIQNHGKSYKAFRVQCELIKLINIVNRFGFPLGYRILSDAVGMPLGEGREVISPVLQSGIAVAKEEMRTVIRRLYDYIEKL